MTFERWLQSRLTSHGFAVGPIDGVVGKQTITAIVAFQFARGLRQTGQADAATVAALRETSSAIAATASAEIPDRDVRPKKDAFQPSSTIWPRQVDCMRYYGPVGTDDVLIDVPYEMVLAWSKSTPIRRMSVHRRVAASAVRALEKVACTYSSAERRNLGLDLFGGSLNVRRMRGGSSWSMHAWGIAIDFDPERNQLSWHRSAARLSHPDAVPFWVAWESEGWLSLGRARDFDWMHVQAARL